MRRSNANGTHAVAPRLLGLATAVPPHVLHQGEVARAAAKAFDRNASAIERLLPVFEHAGVATRHACFPLDWYSAGHDWADCNARYIEHAVDLMKNAANACLERAGRDIAEVDAIVAVSSTGVATPSLDAILMNRMAFRHDVTRLPIFGLGCAGGVLGLARAAALARAGHGLVLFVVVELCSLTFRRLDQTPGNIVATALFADGAAAALVGSGEGPAIVASGERTWPSTLDIMGWEVANDGLGVIFSREIPAVIRRDFRGAVDSYLAAHDMTVADIDEFVCHPGGAKVLAALRESLDLPPDGLAAARDVLHDYGNMSAASVMFVLERMIRPGGGRYLMSALGPGFTAAFLTLESP